MRVYDLETYPNIFTAQFIHVETGELNVFEISDWRDDGAALWTFLESAIANDETHIGYNNVGFDYPIIHLFLQCCRSLTPFTARTAYDKCQQIITSQGADNGIANVIWPSDRLIKQMDLLKIHHFDNKAKGTSLKALQFNMRSHTVEDLPFPPGTVLNAQQREILLSYNFHDITETLKFYYHSLPMVEFRRVLSKKYDRDFTNHNDTKIGKDYLVMQLEKAWPGCTKTQTPRPYINIADVIFPYIRFEQPEFQRIHDWLKKQTITQTKGAFEDVTCTINNFTFVFGLGGIHGSVLSQTVVEDDDHCIVDLDVEGYYPSLSVANNLYPQHLGEAYIKEYANVIAMRKQYAKDTPENAMLKLAGNGTYGDSNNPYSPFYDPQYTMTITVNGQLLLCMLAEQLFKIPSLSLIQINTDGMTIRARRDQLHNVQIMTDWWQEFTRLKLEFANYSKMCIRDVNNYLAVTTAGKVKRKGAFMWKRVPEALKELQWHQDHSELIVPMAAEAALLEGADIDQYIYGHRDIHDFMLRAKVPRNSRLELEDGTQLSNLLRYYIATNGQPLYKYMPPKGGVIGQYKRAAKLTDAYFNAIEQEIGGSHVWDERIHTKNKSKYEVNKTSIQAGYKVWPCNNIEHASFDNIDYGYYIKQAKALVESVQ